MNAARIVTCVNLVIIVSFVTFVNSIFYSVNNVPLPATAGVAFSEAASLVLGT
jgi:hypothetical protein